MKTLWRFCSFWTSARVFRLFGHTTVFLEVSRSSEPKATPLHRWLGNSRDSSIKSLLSFNKRRLVFMYIFSSENTAPYLRWKSVCGQDLFGKNVSYRFLVVLVRMNLFWGSVYWLRHHKMDKRYLCSFFCFSKEGFFLGVWSSLVRFP